MVGRDQSRFTRILFDSAPDTFRTYHEHYKFHEKKKIVVVWTRSVIRITYSVRSDNRGNMSTLLTCFDTLNGS